MSNNRQIVYVAGPMTGIEDYNRHAFDAAAYKLRGEGKVVINPSSNFNYDQSLDHAEYMRYSIHQLLVVSSIYMLKGWQHSDGAIVEHEIAKSLGLEVFFE